MGSEPAKRNWTEYGNLVVLTFTLAVIIWYSLETRRLRAITQEQLSRSYLPLVVVEFKKEIHAGDTIYIPAVRNIGFGPAFNIRISDLKNANCRSDFSRVIAGLGKDSTATLSTDTYCEQQNGESGSYYPDDFTKLIIKPPRNRQYSLSNSLPIVITFQDTRGSTYEIAQEVQWSRMDDPSVQAVVTKFPDVQ
jgi:hypothetical protein